MEDPDATLAPESLRTGASADGPLVGRYTLGALLGRGGTGEVYAADDLLTGDRVAVKLVPVLGAHARRQLRRELSALLALRLPGVVRLRDEGTVADRTFFVTDRIDGVPFTHDAGTGWAAWRPRVLGLLDVLARVHLAGVVHRDLKPANVLVDRDGRVVILDFGLAQGRLVETSTGGWIEGTPRYMAPEQRAALPSDERTDLYAVGGMFLELLTGEPLTRPPRFDGLRRAPVPPELIAEIERMLAEDPADRPSSALEVLAALGADPRDDLGAGMPPGPWNELQLRALFVDKKRSFLHLAEDAAELLFAEAGGEPGASRVVVDRWIRAGLASWSGDGRVVITRSAIEQIAAARPGSPQSELVAMLEAGEEPDAVSAAARRIGAEMAASGHLERALSVLDAAELWARGTPSEQGLLEDRVAWSLGLETPQAAERALYRVQRAEIDPEFKAKVETLLRGARAALGGEPQRALEILAAKPEGLPEPLEIYWHAVRWKAVSQMDLETHERELVGIEDWARSTVDRTSKWHGWLGYLRYRQQRYTEAGQLLLEAARTRRVDRERAQMSYMASLALIEQGDGDGSRRAAEDALGVFRDGRHAGLEAMATWALRMATLRFGPPGDPDWELVEAASDVPSIAGHLALTEAGFAFRSGDRSSCVRLASLVVGFVRSRDAPVAVLAEALLVAMGSQGADPTVAAARATELSPQVALQVFGLLALREGPRPEWQQEGRRLLGLLADRDPDQRLELVSIREARRALDLEPYGTSSASGT